MRTKIKLTTLFLLIPISLYAAEKVNVSDILQRASRQPSLSSSVTRDMSAHNRLVQDLNQKDQEIIRFVNNGISAANANRNEFEANWRQQEERNTARKLCLAACESADDTTREFGVLGSTARDKCIIRCESI